MRDGGVVFVIKPSGYIPAFTEDYVANFFAYHKPEGSPKYNYEGIRKRMLPDELDFALYSNANENRLKIAILGDTQVEIIDHVFHVAKLVGDQLIDEHVDFVVPLGDLVFEARQLVGMRRGKGC